MTQCLMTMGNVAKVNLFIKQPEKVFPILHNVASKQKSGRNVFHDSAITQTATIMVEEILANIQSLILRTFHLLSVLFCGQSHSR